MGLFKKGAPRTPTGGGSVSESSSPGGSRSNDTTDVSKLQSVELQIDELLVDNIERVDTQESGDQSRRKRSIDTTDGNGFILEFTAQNSKGRKGM